MSILNSLMNTFPIPFEDRKSRNIFFRVEQNFIIVSAKCRRATIHTCECPKGDTDRHGGILFEVPCRKLQEGFEM